MTDALRVLLVEDSPADALLVRRALGLSAVEREDRPEGARPASGPAAHTSAAGDRPFELVHVERIGEGLAAAAREGRLLLWSAHQGEAHLLEGTVLDGGLRGVNGSRPVVGVFTQGRSSRLSEKNVTRAKSAAMSAAG